MGNWRTVRIVGACPEAEVAALTEAVILPRNWYETEYEFHCFSWSHSLCGLPLWPAPAFDANGNLGEREFTVEDVRVTLEKLALVAPGLVADVHCGGEYEDPTCVATVKLRAGQATVWPPEVDEVNGVTALQVGMNMMAAMLTPRGGE